MMLLTVWTRVRWSMALVALVVAGAGCAASSYIGYKTSPDYPKDRDETIAIPGLHQPVKVYLDAVGVAHIDAADEVDLVRATGFFQARNRFFAMDMMRRFARGRMSELVGEQPILEGTTVKFDVSMRGWGIDQAVQGDVAALDPGSRVLMEAFVEGVNAGMARYLPLEYRLLRVQPEPWTLADSFALGRLNAWGVTHNWQQELSRLLLALSVGIDRASLIYGNDWWHGGTSLPPDAPIRALPPAIAPELAGWFPPRPYEVQKQPGDVASDRTAPDATFFTCASNSWVVSGQRSASGRPISANDPHLSHMLPSLFYQQHLRAPGLDVIGASIAGLPYVLAGHNENVAWGTTSAVGDAVDLYIEKQNPANPDEVLTSQGYRPIGHDEEVVRIRRGAGFEERRFVLRRTAHGAILNDMYPNLFPANAPLVALRWDPKGVSASIAALSQAGRARSVEELRTALLAMAAPASTWTAADTSGAIALFVTGEIPGRKNHLGTFPVPGWLDAYEWSPPVDPPKMPFAVSRTGGVFAHANNLVRAPDTSAVFVNVDAAPSYRFDRITELLAARPQHTSRSMADIQMDVKLNRAVRLAPLMLQDLATVADWTPLEAQALGLLKAWDFEATVQSVAASVFQSTYRQAIIGALRDEVDRAGFEFLMSQRYSTNVADMWFDRVDHVVWDDRATPAIESRRDVVVAAFRAAVARLASELGPVASEWRWGRLHTLQIRHAFGSQKSLKKFVNLPQVEVGGGLDSVWKSHFDLGNDKTPFAAVAGPAYRHVVDLADIRHGLWISDTGVSGWPGAPHYGDQHPSWLRGEFVPMVSDWDEIRASARAVVTLSPGVGKAGAAPSGAGKTP